VTLEPGIAAREGGHIYEGVSGTLRANAGDNQMAVAVPYTLKIRGGVEVDFAGKAAGKGALIQTNLSATLGTSQDQYLFEPKPVPFCKSARAQTKDDATTWKEGTVANTLNTFDQGEARANELVVYAVDQGGGKSGANVSENQAPTLCTTHGGEPAVAYGLDPQAVAYLASGKETVGTLMANAGTKLWLGNQEAFSGDYAIIEEKPLMRYIVRRLTPTECARLQGFADWWGIVEQKDSLTDEEYQFWHEARNTHARINGKKVQDYTEKQMLTWYNKLYTDSAEYKMWGNGIALPPALYCLQGIVEALNKPEDDLDDWMM
jgi:DNA (cytosine-5)-methyltransferase 1